MLHCQGRLRKGFFSMADIGSGMVIDLGTGIPPASRGKFTPPAGRKIPGVCGPTGETTGIGTDPIPRFQASVAFSGLSEMFDLRRNCPLRLKPGGRILLLPHPSGLGRLRQRSMNAHCPLPARSQGKTGSPVLLLLSGHRILGNPATPMGRFPAVSSGA